MDIPGFRSKNPIHESSITGVYRALRQEDGRPVVLKALRPAYPTADQLNRLKREFSILKHLDGKGSPRAFKLHQLEKRLIIEMEDNGGIAVNQTESIHGMQVPRFLRLAKEIAGTLNVVHEQKIIHRDINPANIIWNPETGSVKLIDFGSAIQRSEAAASVVDPEHLEGTLAYMSPEQTGRLNRALDLRTDLYSLGVTFYQLLTGRLPFESDDPGVLMHAHLARDPVAPHVLAESVPQVLSAITLKLMAKDPEQRYRTSGALYDDLSRCLDLLETGQSLTSFEPESMLAARGFDLEDQAIGRNWALWSLADHFYKVRNGEAVTLVISASPGLGKTALIEAFRKEDVLKDTMVLTARCGDSGDTRFFLCWRQVFGHLMERLLTLPDAELSSLREEIAEVIGINGNLLARVVPRLGDLVRLPTNPEDTLPVVESERFLSVVLRFLGLVANRLGCLVIALDDVHLADQASQTLMHAICVGRLPNIMLLLSMTPDETGDQSGIKASIKLSATEVMRLEPLDRIEITKMLELGLDLSKEEADSLVEPVFAKAAGNPRLTRLFVEELIHRRVLVYDNGKHAWTWDREEIEGVPFDLPVAYARLDQLESLPTPTRNLLRRASCIGETFDVRDLTALNNQGQSSIFSQLRPAIQKRILLPVGSTQSHGEDEAMPVQVAGDVFIYRFCHPRVREVVYEGLKKEGRIDRLHLQIGNLLKTRPTQRLIDRVAIADQLNLGRKAIKDFAQLEELAQLNLEVGMGILGTGDTARAVSFFECGLQCLNENDWELHHDLAFELTWHLSQATHHIGDEQRAARLCEKLLRNSRTREEKIETCRLAMTLFSATWEVQRALAAGRLGLKALGISMPRQVPNWKLTLMSQKLRLKLRLSGIPKKEAGLSEEEQQQLDMLMGMTLPCRMTDRNLHAWLVAYILRFCLDRGTCPEMAYSLTSFGRSLSHYGHYREAVAVGVPALALAEDGPKGEFFSKALMDYALNILPWQDHWSKMTIYLRRAFDHGLEMGELFFASQAGLFTYHWDPNQDLKTVLEEESRQWALLRGRPQYRFDRLDNEFRRYHFALLGLNARDPKKEAVSYEDATELQEDIERRSVELYFYHMLRLKICWFFGEEKEGLDHLAKLESLREVVGSVPAMVEVCLFGFLLHAGTSVSGEKKALISLTKDYKQMKRWAEVCPHNYGHLLALMEAEIARLKNRHGVAGELYQVAIETAERNEYLVHQAMANELTGRYYQGRGRKRIASGFMREAHYLYSTWGAAGKCDLLEKEWQDLFEMLTASSLSSSSPMTSGETSSRLDLAAVVNGLQAVSEEIVLDKLIVRLMKVLIQSAGAQRGLLVLNTTDTSQIRAETDDQSGEVTLLSGVPLESTEGALRAPVSLVLWVNKNLKDLVIADATGDSRFSQDPYVVSKKPRSVLCLPLIKQDQLVGTAYLENRLIAGAFSHERLDLLRLMAAEAAVALENAQLVAKLEEARQTLEEKVEQRTAELALRNDDLASKNRELEYFDEIVKGINREIELERVLQNVMELGIDLFPQFDKGQFLLWNEQKEAFCFEACVGYNLNIYRQITFTWEDMKEASNFYRSEPIHAAIYSSYLERDPLETLDEISKLRFMTWSPFSISMSVMDKDKLVGVMSLQCSKESEDMDQLDTEGLIRFYEHVVSAIGKARLLREVQSKNQEIMRTQEQMVMQEKMASLGTLTAGVAHEINNPANFVAGGSQNLVKYLNQFREFIFTLAGEDADPDILKVIEDRMRPLFDQLNLITEGTSRITAIVQDLRTITRRDQAAFKQTDLCGIVNATLNLVRSKYLENVDFYCSLPDNIEIACHPAELGQVMMNLIVNGCQAITRKLEDSDNPQGKGTFSIVGEIQGEEAVLQFTDTGEGMTQEVQDKIFEPFFTTKPVGQGTGLGLSISYGIIEKHGGRIEVSSTPSEGTTFTMTLPLNREDPSEPVTSKADQFEGF
ncbi:MAG: ATP-binding protein [Acidobacteriota bacterium]|nr:ATP-binding protein [Acidobacteriota bacterium]